jgi:hypothetical protein
MRNGQVMVEGTPAELLHRLDGRILELRGQPLSVLRSLVEADQAVETALMFGDRLHLRVRSGTAQEVIAHLHQRIPAAGAEITLLRPVPAQLEDVFIALQEG